MSLIEKDVRGSTLVLTVNNPPVNVLSPGVPEGLLEGLAEAEQNESVQSVVIIGGGSTFIAGADIKTFSRPLSEAPDVRGLIARLDSFTKPVVAAIHGTALGGGLEVALACHYRVADPKAKLGLPEVKLGLLPGAGGTQRLPRLIGVEAALPIMLTGEPLRADKAKALGLVDEVVEGDLLTAALEFAQKVQTQQPLPRVSERKAEGSAELFAAVRKQLEGQAKGLYSPFLIVDLAEAAVNLPFEEGIAKEAEAFMQALESPQSQGLRHIFFAEREAGKIAGLPKGTPTRDIKKVAIIGAGTMGGGIAMNFANAGIPVIVVETKAEALERGLNTIRKNYEGSAKKGKLTAEEVERRMGLITGTLEMSDVAAADLIIEAVFENMGVKKSVFAQLESVTKPEAILATNTSTLDVNELAVSTRDPSRVLGMHFFSPANVMQLLEVVRGEKTAADVLATVMGVAKTIRKVAVVVGVCDGFVGNRMINVYGREAEFLLEEGATPQQVDAAMHAFGFPMGAFEMGDMAGLDIGYAIRQRQAATRDEGERYSGISDRIVEAGRLGQKSGSGYYRYEAGNRKPIPDPEVDALIESYRSEKGFTARDISQDEITKRLLYSLINEGAKILEEGIAQRPGDIDVIYVYGYGFPPYRGGVMHYADSVGLANILADVESFHTRFGDHWQPAPLLQKLAQEGKGFAQYEPEGVV